MRQNSYHSTRDNIRIRSKKLYNFKEESREYSIVELCLKFGFGDFKRRTTYNTHKHTRACGIYALILIYNIHTMYIRRDRVTLHREQTKRLWNIGGKRSVYNWYTLLSHTQYINNA